MIDRERLLNDVEVLDRQKCVERARLVLEAESEVMDALYMRGSEVADWKSTEIFLFSSFHGRPEDLDTEVLIRMFMEADYTCGVMAPSRPAIIHLGMNDLYALLLRMAMRTLILAEIICLREDADGNNLP